MSFKTNLTKGVGTNINVHSDYIVLLQHPETDKFENSYSQMNKTLEAISRLNRPAVIFWPNVDAGTDGISKSIRIFRETHPSFKYQYIKNLEGKIFLRLLQQSKCLVGNSSVGIRECAYLGVPIKYRAAARWAPAWGQCYRCNFRRRPNI